jgi:hypothetical protein
MRSVIMSPTTPLTGSRTSESHGVIRWIDKRWSQLGAKSASGGVPTMELPAYSAVDLNASIARPLCASFVRNLTDTRGKLSAFVQGYSDSPPASIEERILQPRSIGVGFEYAF